MSFPNYPEISTDSLADDLVAMSRILDAHNSHRGMTEQLLLRVTKIAEENGEVVAAVIGLTGQNPRKGVTHSVDDVVKELLDVASTALGAVEHIDGNHGRSVTALVEHVHGVRTRLEASL